MAFESITNEKIKELLLVPKKVVPPHPREKKKNCHVEKNFSLQMIDNPSVKFSVYVRQNTKEGMEDDFSCGIAWIAPNSESLTLRRYNGPNHNHPNHLEKEKLGYTCHIHEATEKYILANQKAEGYAVATERYKNLDEALECLQHDCNIEGMPIEYKPPESLNLFD